MIEIEQIIPPGVCAECRGCCRFSQKQGPWLPHLLETESELKTKTSMVGHKVKGETPFRCVSLDTEGNRCSIYETRPFECRLYPFVLNKNGSSFFLSVDPNCPFVREQENAENFKAHCVRLTALLGTPQIRQILRRNTHLFQPYPGVRDIAELGL